MSFEVILGTTVAEKYACEGKVMDYVFVYQDKKSFVLKYLVVPEFKT